MGQSFKEILGAYELQDINMNLLQTHTYHVCIKNVTNYDLKQYSTSTIILVIMILRLVLNIIYLRVICKEVMILFNEYLI